MTDARLDSTRRNHGWPEDATELRKTSGFTPEAAVAAARAQMARVATGR